MDGDSGGGCEVIPVDTETLEEEDRNMLAGNDIPCAGCKLSKHSSHFDIYEDWETGSVEADNRWCSSCQLNWGKWRYGERKRAQLLKMKQTAELLDAFKRENDHMKDSMNESRRTIKRQEAGMKMLEDTIHNANLRNLKRDEQKQSMEHQLNSLTATCAHLRQLCIAEMPGDEKISEMHRILTQTAEAHNDFIRYRRERHASVEDMRDACSSMQSTAMDVFAGYGPAAHEPNDLPSNPYPFTGMTQLSTATPWDDSVSGSWTYVAEGIRI